MEEVREEKPNSSTPLGTSPQPLKQIRTFQGDVATALKRQEESLVSIQRIEATKRGDLATSPEPGRNNSLLFFLGSLALIGLGVLGAWFAYNEFLRKTAPPMIVAPEGRFVPSEKSTQIDSSNLSREKLISKVAEASAGVAETNLSHLILPVTSAEFLETLESHAPGSLVRALDPFFMLGSIGEKRFIIFKLTSFENAFAGMLSWEERLGGDLGSLFSSASLLENIGPESTFKDTISKNKDARVLYGPVESGSTTTAPIILYSFLDNRMLIITESLETLEILIERLTRELLSR